MRGTLSVVLGAAGVLASAVAADAAGPPPGAHALGGVNLTAYCQHYYGGNYRSAVLGSSAYDWRCVPITHHAGTTTYPILVQNACLLQYRLPGLVAVALNPSDPTSWQCFQGGRGIHPL